MVGKVKSIRAGKRVAFLFKNGTALLFNRQSSILSAAFVIMAMTAVSRILGLVRDRLLAGTNFDLSLLGVYFAAFRLPDLLFQLLVFGALSVAFIPIFTEQMHKRGEQGAWKLASALLTIALVVFLIVGVVVFIFAKPFSILIAPGLLNENAKHLDLMVQLTRIILIAQIFFVVSSFFTGILQSYHRFLVPALAAVFYNIGIILGIVFLSPTIGVYGPAVGAVIGAFLHLLVQVPLVYSLGFRYRPSFDWSVPGVADIVRLMVPRTVSLAADQIALTVSTILASLVSLRSITVFNFAQHLQVVPLGLFGATIAQAALPTLSSEYSQEKVSEFRTTLLTSLHQILFLVVPTSALLIALRVPIVRLVFGASQFDWAATVATGKTVALLSVGLFAQAGALLFIRGFYAMKDTMTPLKISMFGVTISTLLSVLFIQWTNSIWWLGAASSIASIVDFFLLLYVLDRKVGGFDRRALFLPAIKIGSSGVFMAFVLWILMKLLDQVVFDTTRTINLIFLTATVGTAGLSLFLFLTWALRVREVTVFWEFFRKMTGWKQVVSESKEVINGPTTTP